MKMCVLSLRKLISKIIYEMFEIASATILSRKWLQEVKLKTNKTKFYFYSDVLFSVHPNFVKSFYLLYQEPASQFAIHLLDFLLEDIILFVFYCFLFCIYFSVEREKRFFFFFWFKIIFLHYSFTIFLLSCFYPVQQFLWMFFYIFPI